MRSLRWSCTEDPIEAQIGLWQTCRQIHVIRVAWQMFASVVIFAMTLYVNYSQIIQFAFGAHTP